MMGIPMKRVRNAMVLMTAMAASLLSPVTALAEHLTGSSDWHVTYTSTGRLDDNYSESGVEADIRRLQPGDDLTVSVGISHDKAEEADWYVSNEVLKSLEAGDATDSGYGYVLSYDGPSGTKEIYRSETVGGTGSKGLTEATSSLKDYFFLDTLSKGDKGRLTLVVSLDGETELNAYFDKFARIRLMFAVEEKGRRSGSSNDIVKTGEETDLLPAYVAMMCSGAGLMFLIVWDGRRRERKEGEKS
jgi:hypothetical protein